MEQANTPFYPIKLNFDAHPTKIKSTEGRMIKGTRIFLSRNQEQNTTSGTGGMIVPVQSNEIFCEGFELPDGINKTIGAFENREVNEIYWFVWNDNGYHSVNLIDGSTQTCTKVFEGNCLNFSLLPEHAIPEHSVFVRVQYGEENGYQTVKEKLLIFTDGFNNQRQINVIASIATNSFTTNYFAPVYPFHNCCDFITLAPLAPNYRPEITYVERVEDADGFAVDKELPNKLFNRSIQIAYRAYYPDGRPTSVSAYSKPIIVGGTDCSEQNPETLPRCVDIKLWAGSAFYQKIDIFFRECTTCVTGDCSTNWQKYDTIDKHDCEEDKNWWERTNGWSDYNYQSSDNTITYRFCANKECVPVDQAIFEHIENDIPFASKSQVAVGDRLGFANNLRGSNNMTCEERDSFDVTVEENPRSTCEVPKRDIDVYVIIRNDSEDEAGNGNENGFLFGNSKNGDSPIDSKYYWGGFGWREHPTTGAMKVAIDGRSGWDSWKEYDQYVPSKIDDATGGFVGYLAGTNYVAVSEQVKFFPDSCDVEDVGIIYRDLTTMYDTNGSFDDVVEALASGEYMILQRFRFKDVAAGKYVFRIAGHRTGMNLGYERTSTYVYLSENITACPLGSDEYVTPAIAGTYELTIDVCDYDYNSINDGKLMIIRDLTYPDFGKNVDLINKVWYNFVSELYLYEDDDHSIPFEKQQLNFTHGTFRNTVFGTEYDLSGNLQVLNPNLFPVTVRASDVVSTPERVTDHNGFVFYREQFYRRERIINPFIAGIMEWIGLFTEPTLGHITMTYVDQCSTSQLQNIVVGITKVQPPVTLLNNKGYRGLKGTEFKSTGTADKDCNRILIKGKILSDEGEKLAGINVGYTGSQFVRTDGFGNFTLTVHQNLSYNRSDYFIISNSGSACMIACIGGSDEGSCTLCCSDTYMSVTLPTCVDCDVLEVDMGEFEFKKINFPDRGLKGRYGFGVIGWDCYGRIVTGGVNVIKYVDIEECWNAHPIIIASQDGTTLNPEIKYLSWFRTPNLNGTTLQWVADSFFLLDANGNKTTNKGIATAVAVDINSLLEYNKAHNFGTLINYQFKKGDILRILDDCENPIQYIITGTTYGKIDITALEQELTVTNTSGDTATSKTNYATPNGATLIIAYDSRIENLMERCAIKIEILTPFSCENNLNPYCEVSELIPVKNGVLQDTEIILDTWDIYKIFRNIPKNASCEENPSDDPYFSQNITDFWGEGCTDCGRRTTENPYAERKWIENELAVSFDWINNGIVNGLATFWPENRKNFKGQDWGGINAMNAQRGAILFVCENDWFITSYDQNYLIVNSDGAVTATLPDKISDPTQKIGMNFGVSQEHKSSVIFYEGVAYWLDAKNGAIIGCDYRQAKDITPDSIKGWTVDKTMFIQNFNEAHKNDYDYANILWEVVAGICPLHKEYHITIRPRQNLIQDIELGYINHERDIITEVGETMVFNQEMNMWVNMRAYTPEYYGKLRTSKTGLQFISFVNGKPYKHNGDGTSYNTFYGIPTTPVIEISANHTDGKVKIFGAITEEIQPFALFVDRILTEEKNSFSYIPQAYFEQKENIQYAGILMDMSSYFDPNIKKVSMLVDGKRIFGRYALIRFVCTFDNQNQFFELAKFWVLCSGSELSMKPQIAAPDK